MATKKKDKDKEVKETKKTKSKTKSTKDKKPIDLSDMCGSLGEEDKPKKAKGRPKAEINEKQFIKLCEIHCTLDECCAVLGVADKTLIKWCKETYGLTFRQAFKKFSAGGKASLRKSNFAMAQVNPTMAIWLAKQHLGEQDNPEMIQLRKEELEFRKMEAERNHQIKLKELELKAKMIDAQLVEWDDEAEDKKEEITVNLVRSSERVDKDGN